MTKFAYESQWVCVACCFDAVGNGVKKGRYIGGSYLCKLSHQVSFCAVGLAFLLLHVHILISWWVYETFIRNLLLCFEYIHFQNLKIGQKQQQQLIHLLFSISNSKKWNKFNRKKWRISQRRGTTSDHWITGRWILPCPFASAFPSWLLFTYSQLHFPYKSLHYLSTLLFLCTGNCCFLYQIAEVGYRRSDSVSELLVTVAAQIQLIWFILRHRLSRSCTR